MSGERRELFVEAKTKLGSVELIIITCLSRNFLKNAWRGIKVIIIMVEFLEYEWNIRNAAIGEISRKEQPADENQALKELQSLIASCPNLSEEKYTDNYLNCFLRARSFNPETAFRMISCRYFLQKKHPTVFSTLESKDPSTLLQGGVMPVPINRQKEWVRAALEEGLPGVLSEKDPRGCYTLLFFPGQWDPNVCPLLEGVLHATLLSLESLIEENGGKISHKYTDESKHWRNPNYTGHKENEKPTYDSNLSQDCDGGQSSLESSPLPEGKQTSKQIDGKSKPSKSILPPKVVAIVDWSGFSMSRCGTLMSSGIRTFIECLQSCIPVNCEGIHFVSQPWHVDAALKLLRPFLTEKTREKLHVHGNNLSQLHSMVGQRHLPAELGGDGPPFHTIKWADRIFKEEEVDTKREVKE